MGGPPVDVIPPLLNFSHVMKKPFENQSKRKMEALRGPGRSAPAARLSRRGTAKSEFPCHPWFILSAPFSLSFATAVVDEFGVRNSPFAFDLSVSKHTQNTPDFGLKTQGQNTLISSEKTLKTHLRRPPSPLVEQDRRASVPGFTSPPSKTLSQTLSPLSSQCSAVASAGDNLGENHEIITSPTRNNHQNNREKPQQNHE